MTFLSDVFPNGWLMLVALQSTAIMGVALLVASALPRAAAIRSCVLLSAAICTFVGPAVLLVCSLTGYTIEMPLRAGRPDNRTEAISSRDERREPPRPVDIGSAVHGLAVATPATHPTVTASQPAEARHVRLSCQSWLLILWTFGSLVYGLGIVISMVRIRHILGTAKPISEEMVGSAKRQAAANLGVDEFPRVAVSAHVHSPVAVGLLGRAWVLLPQHCLHRMSHDQLVQVLTHEGAHVLRRDPLIRLLQRINIALWWWNPLTHILHGQLSRAREEVCDNVVLSRTDAEVYGTTLLELGKLISTEKHLVGSVSLFGSRWSLEHRIKGLLNPRRKMMVQVNRTVSVLVLAAFAGVTVLTSVARLDAQESRERENEERRARHERVEHLAAAHHHLKLAGLEELAHAVAQRAEELEKSLHAEAPGRHDEQAERRERAERRELIERREQDERRERLERYGLAPVRRERDELRQRVQGPHRERSVRREREREELGREEIEHEEIVRQERGRQSREREEVVREVRDGEVRDREEVVREEVVREELGREERREEIVRDGRVRKARGRDGRGRREIVREEDVRDGRDRERSNRERRDREVRARDENEFRQDVHSTLRELSKALRQLRRDVDSLKQHARSDSEDR